MRRINLRAIFSLRAALFVLLSLTLLAGAPLLRAQQGDEGEDVDLVIIVDNSASMCCTQPPNDPSQENGSPGIRYQMADLFISFFGADQSANDYRLGFVFFGSDAQKTAELTSLDSAADRSSLRNKIHAVQENLGWTHHQDALRAAREILANGRPGARKGVVLLTDGEPRLADWPISDYQDLQTQYFAGMRADLAANWPDDTPIFTVAFSQEAFRHDPRNQLFKNFWEELAASTGAPADVGYQEAITAKDLPNIYINIIRSLVGLETGVTFSPPEPAPVTKTFVVDTELSQIIFVVLKDNPDITTQVYDPNGQPIVPPSAANPNPDVVWEVGDRQETISVSSPEQGTWSVALNGQGFIQFQPVPFPLDLEYGFNLVSPLRGHPAGKPLAIVVSANERKTGATEPLLSGSVAVTYPSGAMSAPLTFRPIGNDTYAALLEDTLETGRYLLSFSGEIAVGTIHGESAVQVLPAPWLRIQQPVGEGFPSNLPVPIEAQLMWLNQPLTQIDPTWSLIASATLFDEAGVALSSLNLRPQADGLFRGEVDPEGEGVRTIELGLLIETAGGEQFTDLSRSDFVVGASVTLTPTPTLPPSPTPPPTATPTPPPPPAATPVPPEPLSPAAVGGGLGGGLLLLAGGVAAVYVMRQPKLSGELIDQSGVVYPLRGRKPWTIGSDAKANIVLSGESVAPLHARLRPYNRSVVLVNLVSAGGAPGDGSSDFDDYTSAPAYAPLEVRSEGSSYQTVSESYTLQHNDQIRIGNHELTYSNVVLTAPILTDDNSGPDDGGIY